MGAPISLKRLASTLSVVTILVLSGVTIGLYEAYTNPIFALGTSTSISATSASFSGTSAFENITSSTGSLLTPANYIIFNQSSTVYARNGFTGGIDYSSSSLATVIQSAHDALVRGGRIYLLSNLPTLASTVNITRNHIGLEFDNQGGSHDYTDGTEYLMCTANPCFNITGRFVSFTGGQFRSTTVGAIIFKITGAAQVTFTGQNFFATAGMSRDILPYFVNINTNGIDVKISNVNAWAKNFIKVYKDPAAVITRQSVQISHIYWKSDGLGGTGVNITSNTQTIFNVMINDFYGWSSTGTLINMSTVNNGAIQTVEINNVYSQMNNGISINAPTGYISAVNMNNVDVYASSTNSRGIQLTGHVHSIKGTNIDIEMGGSAGARGFDLRPTSGTEGGFYNEFTNVRIYDTLGTQTSIYANGEVKQSSITGKQLYMQYSNINTSSTLKVYSPLTQNSYTTATFDITSTGWKNISLAHGLDVTPTLNEIQLTVIRNTAVMDWRFDSLRVKSVNSTYVNIELYVSAASGTGGAVAKVAVQISP